MPFLWELVKAAVDSLLHCRSLGASLSFVRRGRRKGKEDSLSPFAVGTFAVLRIQKGEEEAGRTFFSSLVSLFELAAKNTQRSDVERARCRQNAIRLEVIKSFSFFLFLLIACCKILG